MSLPFGKSVPRERSASHVLGEYTGLVVLPVSRSPDSRLKCRLSLVFVAFSRLANYAAIFLVKMTRGAHLSREIPRKVLDINIYAFNN